MIKDMGIRWTLTGHSERRTLYHETDAEVATKTKNALNEGFSVLACIGEQLNDRESGKTRAVNERNLMLLESSAMTGQTLLLHTSQSGPLELERLPPQRLLNKPMLKSENG